MNKGILIVSHIHEIGIGLKHLLKEAAKDVSITVAAGLGETEIGTSFEDVLSAIETNSAEEIYAFYDLGSAKMNLEMACEMTGKTIYLFDTALVEGAYTAATLIQVGVEHSAILDQLEPLKIKSSGNKSR